MRKLLLFCCEFGLLLTGGVFSLMVATMAYSGTESVLAGLLGWLGGAVLPGYAFIKFHRRTRPWEIDHEAAAWLRDREKRRAAPRRAKFQRVAWQILPWLPSALATFVLFFPAAASHLLYPCSRFLPHYRIPIPWNALTVVWSNDFTNFVFAMVPNSSHGLSVGLSSMMTFSSDPDATPDRWLPPPEFVVLQRDLQLHEIPLTCWQYSRRAPFEVTCHTPSHVTLYNLSAGFSGHEKDLTLFYSILERTTPVE